MKKILFALTQNSDPQIEEQIVKCYSETTNNEYEYKREYYYEGLIKLLNEEEYDFLLLNETFEKDKPVTFDFLDFLTDHYPKLTIIYILADSHKKTDYMNSLFALGIYNVLFKKDLIINNIVKLMESPRGKYEFKLYADIEDVTNINVSKDLVNEIDEAHLKDIMEKLKTASDDKLENVFQEIVGELSEKQIIFLIPLIDENIIKKLYESNNKTIVKYSKSLGNAEKQVKFIEVEKSVIKEVEKPVFIEKEIVKVVSVKSNSVISFISNSSNGKSYVSWNLAYALSKNKLKVAYFNIDSVNSANCYFGIDEENLPLKNLEQKMLKEIIDEGIEINNNLTVYTGEFANKTFIKNDVFLKILNHLRTNNNIVILDTATGYNDNLLTAINHSNDIVFVYDLDNSHLKLNDLLINKLGGHINLKNTVAIINNSYPESKELKNITKHLKKTYDFKDVINISNCGKTTYDYMYSNTCNYLEDNNEFTNDLDSLIRSLNLEVKENKNKNRSFFKIFGR